MKEVAEKNKVNPCLEALEEIKRNCEPWRTADSMAGRLWKIADYAIRQATTGGGQ